MKEHKDSDPHQYICNIEQLKLVFQKLLVENPSMLIHQHDIHKLLQETHVCLEGLEKQVEALKVSNLHLEDTLDQKTIELQKEQVTLAEIQQLANIGSWEWNVAENTMVWSDELFRILGLEPQQFDPTLPKFLQYIHIDDREFVENKIVESHRTQKSFSFYHRIIRADGFLKNIHTLIKIISDKSNTPVKIIGTSQDVTKRLLVERKFQSLLNVAPDAVVILNDRGIIKDWNLKAEKIFDWKGEEVVGKRLSDVLVLSQYKSDKVQSIDDFLKTDYFYEEQLSMLAFNKSGIQFPIEISLSALEFGHERVFIAFIRDITESEKSKNSLEEKEELYRTVVESVSEGLLITDVEDKIIFVNSRLEALTGYKKEEIVGKIAYEMFLSIDQHEQLKKRMLSHLAGKYESYELTFIRKDKSHFIAYVNAAPFRNSKGEIIGTVGAITDITISKRQKELENLIVAATQSFNAVNIRDKDGKIEWVNDGFVQFFGYGLEDMKGTYGEVLLKNDELGFAQQMRYYDTIRKDKKPITYENKKYNKSGREYWVLTTLTPVLDEGEEMVKRIISIEADITLRKRMELDLIKANMELSKTKTQLEATAKLKEQFLANMSHEIRTPMNGIIGLTDVLLKTPLTPEQSEYLTAIKNSGDTLLVVINDILDISKIEAGKMTFEEIPFSIANAIDSVVDLFYPKAKEKNLTIKKSVDKNLKNLVLGDVYRLNQIIMNLVSNAVKFTESGSITIIAEQAGADDESALIELRVQDTGRGIPTDKLNSIFLDFTQVSAEITRKYGGTGLGLSITKKLVELQGGTIHVESEVGKGSTFIIQMKYKKCKDSSQYSALYLPDEQYEQSHLQGLKTLVVEDNPVNQLLVEKLLNDWGAHVDLAESGEIAISKLKKEAYDIILMDIKMPGMDGYETTHVIRNELPAPVRDLPIIAVTAHAATWEAEKCIKAGMNDYISKPFNAKEFHKKIAKLVGKKTKKNTAGPPKEKTLPSLALQLPVQNSRYTDLSYLNEVSNGNKEFIQRMISAYIDQTNKEIVLMQQHFENKEWEGLSAIAHKLKPSLRYMGIKSLIEPILTIEKLCREPNPDKENLLKNIVSEVIEVCKISVNELKEELEKISV